MENKKNDFLNDFLKNKTEQNTENCPEGVCLVKGDKSLIERINKKIIVEDGRQLLC